MLTDHGEEVSDTLSVSLGRHSLSAKNRSALQTTVLSTKFPD